MRLQETIKNYLEQKASPIFIITLILFFCLVCVFLMISNLDAQNSFMNSCNLANHSYWCDIDWDTVAT